MKIQTSMTPKDELIFFLSELRHCLTKNWLIDKDKTNFKALTYKIIDDNLTSIEKQIKRL